jgi:hypothetical protein
MARGGYRPTAPQNNPMKVNGRGGNGQSGTQAAKYVSGLPYGEGQELMNIQQSAPLAAAPSIEQTSAPSGLASAAASQSIIPLNAPSQRPDEPVTFGADAGPGPGMEVLGAMPQGQTTAQVLLKLLPYDETGEVAALYEQALLRGL